MEPGEAIDGTTGQPLDPVYRWNSISLSLFDLPPPASLTPASIRIWNWYRDHLSESRKEFLPVGVAPQFAMLCKYESWLANHEMEEMPPSIATANGNMVMNPDLQMYDKLMARVQTMWRNLALSPVYLLSHGPTIDGVAEPGGDVVRFYLPRNNRDNHIVPPPGPAPMTEPDTTAGSWSEAFDPPVDPEPVVAEPDEPLTDYDPTIPLLPAVHIPPDNVLSFEKSERMRRLRALAGM